MNFLKITQTKSFRTVCVAFILASASVSAEEIQLNCKFTSSTKLLEANTVNPKYETKKEEDEYLIFIKKEESSYINLGLMDLKIKAPLKIIYSSDSMITLIEDVNKADNHFSISVFWKDGNKNEYPAVRFFHSWAGETKSGFYNPEITLGVCSLFTI